MPFGDPKGNMAGTGGYGGNFGGTQGNNNSLSGGYGGTGGWGQGLQGGWTSGIMGQTRDSQAAAAGANAPRSDSTNGYVPGQPLPTAKPKQLAAVLGSPPPSPTPTPAPQPGFGVPDPMQQAWTNVGTNYPGRLPGISGIVTGDMGTGYGPYGRDFSNPVSNVGAKGDYQGGGIAIGRR